MKFVIFTGVKNCCMLHGRVFVMKNKEPQLLESRKVNILIQCTTTFTTLSYVWSLRHVSMIENTITSSYLTCIHWFMFDFSAIQAPICVTPVTSLCSTESNLALSGP